MKSRLLLLGIYAWSITSPAIAQYNATQHPLWPMTVGSRWIYRTYSADSDRNGIVTVFEVRPSPFRFGCLQPGSPAYSPYEIAIFKTDPRAYWNINTPQNLRWMLGVQPTGAQPLGWDGSLFALGWYITDLAGVPWLGSTVNLRSTSSEVPPYPDLPYLLLRGSGTANYSGLLSVYQTAGSAPSYSCGGSLVLSDSPWNVTYNQDWYSVPAYTGSALKAQYNEQAGAFVEDWYFAQGIGPILIHTHNQMGYIPSQLAWQQIQLVSYQPGTGSAAQPGVALRDALIARAGGTAGRSFYDWNYDFQLATGLAGPNPSYACVSDPTAILDVDTYLARLESVGGTCSNLSYPPLSNGSNANTVAQSMSNVAGSTPLQDFDHWNYIFQSITQLPGPAPENACMRNVNYTDSQTGNQASVVSDRYMLLTARQWLLFYEHSLFGCS